MKLQRDRLYSRAGEYLEQQAGYRAYLPRDLPPAPPLTMEAPLVGILCAAERSLGRLTGYAETLADPGGLAQLALRAEAVISGRLDGAAVSLTDLLLWELDGRHGLDREQLFRGEVRMAGNGVDAENWGLRQVAGGDGISTVLMMQLHARLFKGLRGRESGAGQLRRAEIWIGPSGSTLATAAYVPPPPDMVPDLMRSLERFIQADAPSLPPLVGAACIYYQLEAIHPFLDGSGRLARLMIPLILHREGVALPQLLGLSACFARDRTEHFRRLQLVRERGDWESWVLHFGTLLRDSARAGSALLVEEAGVLDNHEEQILRQEPTVRDTAIPLLRHLASHPIISVPQVAQVCGRSFANANLLVGRLEALGIVIFSSHNASNLGNAKRVISTAAADRDNPRRARQLRARKPSTRSRCN